MGDQGRWFKLWATAPADPSLQALPPALRWAWAALGCYTKIHGSAGVLIINGNNPVLAAEMGVAPDAIVTTLKRLPHVIIGEGVPVNGMTTVTWKNWIKYQEDSTVAERVKRWRATKSLRHKKRREEKRREEKKPPLSQSPPFGDGFRTTVAATRFGSLLGDLAWWQAELGASHCDHEEEVKRAEAWCLSNPDRAPRKALKRFLHHWFQRAEQMADEREKNP